MRVLDLANELRVAPERLVILLRELGIPVTGLDFPLSDEDHARVLARLERERRGGRKGLEEALEAAIEEAQSAHKPRRRRRRADLPQTPSSEDEGPGPLAPEAAAPESGGEEGGAEGQGSGELPGEISAGETAAGTPEVEVPPALPEMSPEREEEGAEGSGQVEEADEGGAEIAALPSAAAADLQAEPEAGGGGTDAETTLPPAEGAADFTAPIPVREGWGGGEEERPLLRRPEGLRPAVSSPPAGGEPRRPEPVRRPTAEMGSRVIRRPVPTPAASAGPGGQVRIQAEGYTADGRKKKKEKKGKKRHLVDQEEVQSNIHRVLAELKGGGKKRKRTRGADEDREELEALEAERAEQERTTVRVNEFLTVAELGELIGKPANEIIRSAFKNMGLMITINQRLDFDQIELLLEEFGFRAVREEDYRGTAEVEEVKDRPEDLRPRPPVVTVMGHVDHGKTKLLDYIRKTNVVAGEAGGITQHIGAYHVVLPDQRAITFLDTPGHAAFTAMRARGADVTDIVVLVVAADDAVMPQTVEAISHAKNAGVPIVVAINKIDLPTANPLRVKQQLLSHGVTVEDFGGDVLCAEISAKAGIGIEDLLEKILLQAELLDLRANPDRPAQGTVIEAQLDVGKGPVVTVLVQNGTLRVGDSFLCGLYDGRVRALLDERGKPVKEAGPGIPVQVLGTAGVPQAGDAFLVMEAEKASAIAATRQRLEREKQLRIREKGIRLGDFSQLMAQGKAGTLPLIIKGDVDGSVQALSDALLQLSTDEVRVEIVHRAVGAINESDVLLASTAGAVILGFRVRPDANSRELADREGVDVQVFDVIYEAVDQVKAALEGLLAPERREKILGTAEVRETFKIAKVGTIAGCYVTHGTIERGGRVRLIRDGIVVYDGELGSLKRFKDDVREVREGFECGVGIANFNDVKVGDIIECYKVEEVARTLAGTGRR